jgi:hypothetical protein
MPSKRIWFIAIAITLIYWCTYHGIEGAKFLVEIKPLYKYAVNFTLLMLVFGLGAYGLSNLEPKWMVETWLLVYGSVIGCILLFGLADLLLGVRNINLRNFLFSLRMFFSSPLPFGILLLLSRLNPTGPANSHQL